MGKQRDILEKLAGAFQIQHVLLRQALAECLGTLILVMFGCGAVAQLVLSAGSHGTFLTINFAFGFAATLCILTSIFFSLLCGHLNPAVTFSMCLLGREPWRKFPLFFLCQTLGAFLGTAIVFGIYFAGIFATYPSRHLTLVNGFFNHIIGTAALIVCILAIVDPHNNPVPRGLEPFTVGFVVLVIGLSMGFNSGYAVNPARDLGPHIFTALAGWANTFCFFVPICAPFLGAVVGVLIYQLMIGYHLEGEVQEKQKEMEERFKLSNMITNEDVPQI
uniref:Aquaporin-3 n=1 Tax=Sander lucioperca TaxID=283035 RepID=A0A8C9X6N7_SANLU